MRLLALPALGWVCGPSLAGAEYCEWHLDYLVYHRVNYTEDPWSFSLDPSCTALQCSTYLWGSIDDEGAAALAEALRSAPQLEELTIGYNNIGDAGATALAAVLRHVPRLRLLYLGWNGIGDTGTKALAEALEHEPLLEELNLFWNNVGEAGAQALAAALRRHTPRLRKLNLAWNSLGDAGAIALAEALRGTPQLAELSVAWSGIGNPGAIALAGALGHLPRLRELRVRWNSFGERGATALAEAVAALEEAHAGRQVLSSGIPWPILEAARNVSRRRPPAAAAPAGPEAQAGTAACAGRQDAAAPTGRQLAARAVTCATHRCSALVVGNANYTRGRRGLLPGVIHDAKELAAALGHLGFAVSRLFDGTRKQMRSAAKAFFKSVEPDGVGLLYFGGLGRQLSGANHLLPVDYLSETGEKGAEKAVAMSWLLQSLVKRKAAAGLLILDVAHASPVQSKAAVEGLVPAAAPLGTLLAFAAAPEPLPSEPPSPYARRLLAWLREPGLQVEEVLKMLRQDVVNATGGRQVPWESSALTVEFVPNPVTAEAAAPLRAGEL